VGTQADGSGRSLATRTLRGAAWAYGSYAGARLLALGTTAILARLLDPKDFGLVAAALIFITFADTIADLGLGDALVISSDDDVEEQAETAFVSLVGLGVGLAAVIVALAPLASEFFHQPGLTPIMMVLGFNFVLRGLGGTHYALAQRTIDFRSRTAAELADVVARSAVGIGLAVAGFGAWSLVIGYLAGSLAMTVTLWLFVSWRPRLKPRRKHLSPMLRFGGTLSLVSLMTAAMGQIDYIFVGRVLGATALGIYTLAYRLPELVLASISAVASQVLFPAFASVARERLAEMVPRAVAYIAMIAVPLAIGIGVMAEPLVVTLFGEKWAGAAEAMTVLTLAALGTPASIIAGAACKAVGRADVLLKLSVPQFAVLTASIAIFVDKGIVAVAACQVGTRVVFMTIAVTLTTRIVGASVREILRQSLPALLAGAGLAAVLVAVQLTIDPDWLQLVVGGVAGAVVYAALMWLLGRELVVGLWRTARPGKEAPAAPLPPPAPLLETEPVL
jgi:PST family polysaccharide transporter